MTGHILLGLGIASSLLLYMFFNAFDEVGSDSGGYGGHGFFKNKVRDQYIVHCIVDYLEALSFILVHLCLALTSMYYFTLLELL